MFILKFSGDPPLPADDPASPPLSAACLHHLRFISLLLLLRRHCFRYAVRSVTVAPNDEDHPPDLLPPSLYFFFWRRFRSDAPVEVTCVRVHHCRSSTRRLFSNGLFSLKLRWDPHLIATVEAPQQSSSQDTLASSPPS
ncbi:hypothetical protein LXL04_011492 [Taraxacum kok-saghyz]